MNTSKKIISMLLIFILLLTTMLFVSCKRKIADKADNTTNSKKTEDNITSTEPKESVNNTDVDTTDIPATDPVDTQTHPDSDTQEPSNNPSEQTGAGIFKFNEEDKIIGAPGDYDTLVFDINGVSITAKDYFSDNRKEEMEQWHTILKEYAIEDTSDNNNNLSMNFDDNEFEKQLLLLAYLEQLHFGSLNYEPQLNPNITFSINGLTLGDSEDSIQKYFGRIGLSIVPDANGSTNYGYSFESGGFLSIRCYDGKIASITVALSQ